MTWWLWVLAGSIIVTFLLLLGYALAKAAGDEDTRRGYK